MTPLSGCSAVGSAGGLGAWCPAPVFPNREPGTPCNHCISCFPLFRKIPFDHMFDHSCAELKISYPGIAKLVSRLVWERGAECRFSRTASPKALENTAFLVFPFPRKIPFDHMFDHSYAEFKISYPGIAKLVSRLVWDQETVRSSRTTRTKTPLKLMISVAFSLFTAAQNVSTNHYTTMRIAQVL